MDEYRCVIDENYVAPVDPSEIVIIKPDNTLENIGLYFPKDNSIEK